MVVVVGCERDFHYSEITALTLVEAAPDFTR